MSVGKRTLFGSATEAKNSITAASSAEKAIFPTNRVSLGSLAESPNLWARSLVRVVVVSLFFLE